MRKMQRYKDRGRAKESDNEEVSCWVNKRCLGRENAKHHHRLVREIAHFVLALIKPQNEIMFVRYSPVVLIAPE